jgi:ABC-type glycerol-3-phosphate transport system permease component
MHLTRAEKWFSLINHLLLVMLGLLCLAPFVNIFAQSLSGHHERL